MLRTGRLNSPDVVRYTVARQAELRDSTKPQQPRVRRAMRSVTSRTAFSLERRMFVREWTLLVRVTFNASRIGAGGEPRLLQLKAAVRVVAVAALHHSFKNFMVKRLVEVRLRFLMTTHAELRLVELQHVN